MLYSLLNSDSGGRRVFIWYSTEITFYSITMVFITYHGLFAAKLIVCVITVFVVEEETVLEYVETCSFTCLGFPVGTVLFVIHKSLTAEIILTFWVAPTEIDRRHPVLISCGARDCNL